VSKTGKEVKNVFGVSSLTETCGFS
jgi:hypothetical protein